MPTEFYPGMKRKIIWFIYSIGAYGKFLRTQNPTPTTEKSKTDFKMQQSPLVLKKVGFLF